MPPERANLIPLVGQDEARMTWARTSRESFTNRWNPQGGFGNKNLIPFSSSSTGQVHSACAEHLLPSPPRLATYEHALLPLQLSERSQLVLDCRQSKPQLRQ